jgi:S-layer family protein
MSTRIAVCCVLALAAVAAAPAGAQVYAGPEFRVNGYTTGGQAFPTLSALGPEGFVAVWSHSNYGTSVVGRRIAADGSPMGADFTASTFTGGVVGDRGATDVAADRAGNFVVVWVSEGQDGSYTGVFGQRYDAAGARLGGEFQVNTYTTGNQGTMEPGSVGVARAPDGRFVVAWEGAQAYPSRRDVFAQRFDAAGNRVGAEFLVNSYTTRAQYHPDVAIDAFGDFVVVWSSDLQDGSFAGVFGQRFDAAGARQGGEFRVNTTTAGYQSGGQYYGASVARAPGGEFVVVWDGYSPGANQDVFLQRYNASGAPVGSELRVNSATNQQDWGSSVAMDAQANFVVTWMMSASYYGTITRGQRFASDGSPRGGNFDMNNTQSYAPQRFPTVAADDIGNFIVSWNLAGPGEPSDPGRSVRAQRFGGLRPSSGRVDTTGNGVWEPGETVDVRPAWRNDNGATVTVAGTLAGIQGPLGGTYAITDATADYGAVADDDAAECADCYGVSVSVPSPRPVTHWDATVVETIVPDDQGQQKKWTLHIGNSFTDVPAASGFYRFVETLLHRGVTAGCQPLLYCPDSPTTREQMAAFVLLAKEPPGYAPPPCGQPSVFADVPFANPFCRWIEELARRGVVSGCGGGNYCPTQPVTREQMAVFVLRTLDPALVPPPCAPPNLFADVPETSPFCRWVEELAARGVVSGCGGGNYCPAGPVTREQMGVFLGVTFGLTLYGP